MKYQLENNTTTLPRFSGHSLVQALFLPEKGDVGEPIVVLAPMYIQPAHRWGPGKQFVLGSEQFVFLAMGWIGLYSALPPLTHLPHPHGASPRYVCVPCHRCRACSEEAAERPPPQAR